MSLEQKKGGKYGLLSALLQNIPAFTFLVADKRVFGNQIIIHRHHEIHKKTTFNYYG